MAQRSPSRNPSIPFELKFYRKKRFTKLYLFLQRFVAKPITKEDGSINMLKWYCEIPGPEGVNKQSIEFITSQSANTIFWFQYIIEYYWNENCK